MEVIGKILYPEQFNSKRIRTLPRFEEELKDILEKTGNKQRFVKLYRLRLKHLEQYWERCVDKSDWFESLKGEPGLYSMRFNKFPQNIRIIFTFTNYEKRQIALLACTFEEKSKKDYSDAIEIAKDRLKQLQKILG